MGRSHNTVFLRKGPSVHLRPLATGVGIDASAFGYAGKGLMAGGVDDWRTYLNPLVVAGRHVAAGVAGVYGSGAFDEEDVTFFGGDRAVFDTFRDYDQVAFVKDHGLVSVFHREAALHDEERFVGVVVRMPNELAFDFCKFEVCIVHLRNDVRRPLVGNEC